MRIEWFVRSTKSGRSSELRNTAGRNVVVSSYQSFFPVIDPPRGPLSWAAAFIVCLKKKENYLLKCPFPDNNAKGKLPDILSLLLHENTPVDDAPAEDQPGKVTGSDILPVPED